MHNDLYEIYSLESLRKWLSHVSYCDVKMVEVSSKGRDGVTQGLGRVTVPGVEAKRRLLCGYPKQAL